jgi:hypothetical protein
LRHHHDYISFISKRPVLRAYSKIYDILKEKGGDYAFCFAVYADRTQPVYDVLLYQQTHQREKALSLARNFPHIWESREMLLTCIGNNEERQKALDACITSALTLCLYKLQSPTLQQDMDLLGQGLSTAEFSPRDLLKAILQYYA